MLMLAIGRCLWWVYRKTPMLAMGGARVGRQTDADAGYEQCKGGYANRC
jgi:hypothetical protein